MLATTMPSPFSRNKNHHALSVADAKRVYTILRLVHSIPGFSGRRTRDCSISDVLNVKTGACPWPMHEDPDMHFGVPHSRVRRGGQRIFPRIWPWVSQDHLSQEPG